MYGYILNNIGKWPWRRSAEQRFPINSAAEEKKKEAVEEKRWRIKIRGEKNNNNNKMKK